MWSRGYCHLVVILFLLVHMFHSSSSAASVATSSTVGVSNPRMGKTSVLKTFEPPLGAAHRHIQWISEVFLVGKLAWA